MCTMSATSTPKIMHTTMSPPTTDTTAVKVKKMLSEEEGEELGVWFVARLAGRLPGVGVSVASAGKRVY